MSFRRGAGRLDRRSRASLALAGLVFGVMAPYVVVSEFAQAEESPPEPVAFGAFTKRAPGQTERQAVEAFEAQIGRSLTVVRVFETWEQNFPDSYHRWLRDSGHSIILSVKPKRSDGSSVRWATIADAAPGGQIDAEIRSWATRVRDYGVPIYVTMHHEPESWTRLGTDDEFIAAWRHWVDIFREEGATNAEFMWITTEYAHQVSPSDLRYAPKWYPGDDWVDAIAADPYNWFLCRPNSPNVWRTMAEKIEPLRQFGAQHPDKALWLAEFGSVEDDATPGRKAAWFDDVRELFKQPGWEQFDGILYFNSGSTNNRDCSMYVDTSPSSLASFQALGADPFYAGPAFQDDDPPPSTTVPPTTVPPTTVPSTTVPPTTVPPTTVPPTTVPPTTVPQQSEALLVVGSTTLGAGDAAVRDRLETAGFTVTVLDDNDATSTVSDDVVVISSSVSSGTVAATYHSSSVPVLVLKPWLLDDMAMASSFGVNSTTVMTVDDPSHPLAAGLSGTVTLTTRRGPVGWGTPSADAEIVASTTNGASLFAYEPGDLLVDGSSAVSCRAALPFFHRTFDSATPSAEQVFDAVIAWAGDCG